jgi:hypothetical protein
LNGSLWCTEWIPQAHLVVIDVDRFLHWIEGTIVWDRRDIRRDK